MERHRRADSNRLFSIMPALLLLLLRQLAPLALINLIPLAHFVCTGPVNTDLWDLGSSSTNYDLALGAEPWATDPSTDLDLFSLSESPDFNADDNNDLFLAANGPCRSDADLTQFEPYSKIRAREACPANKPVPELTIPTLEHILEPEEGSTNEGASSDGTVNIENLERIFNLPETTTTDDEKINQLCPADRTFTSKVPVCDSGFSRDAESINGNPYSTLYNIQPCWFYLTCHAAVNRARMME